MKKNAQGLSLNTIVVAAIVIIVLIVTISIFVNKSDDFVSAVDTCKDKAPGTRCVEKEKATTSCGALRFGNLGCAEGYVCCNPP